MKRKIVIFISALCLLTGCGNNATKQIANAFDATEAVVQDKSTEINEEDNDNKSNKGKQIKYTVNSRTTNGTMVVDAEYESFPTEQLKTFSMTYQAVTDEYLFDLASRIFDDHKYEITKPSYIKTPAEAKDELADIERQMKELSPDNIVGGMIASSYYFNLLNNRPREEAPKDGKVLVEYTEEFPEDNLILYITVAELQGKIDGKDYILEYWKVDTENTKTKVYEKGFGRIMLYNKVASPCKDYYQDMEGDGSSTYCGDNLSDYDEALKKANTFIQSLGVENFELTKQQYAIVDTDRKDLITEYDKFEDARLDGLSPEEKHITANGYSFYFSPVIDDIPILVSSSNVLTTELDDGIGLNPNKVEQPLIVINVDDYGINNVTISDMYSIVEETASDAPIIDFELADANVQAAYEQDYKDYFTVGKIKAEYRIVKYDNNYAMVPVWVYYSTSFGLYEDSCFAVNAIDGTVYHLAYNFDIVKN